MKTFIFKVTIEYQDTDVFLSYVSAPASTEILKRLFEDTWI